MNNIKLPEENTLKEIQRTSQSLTDTMNSLKDSTAITNLDNLVSRTIPTVSDIVHKSTEYSNILKQNMESVSRIVTEINNIKLPEEKILKELQITAHFISETINNMKDTNAMKSLDNLVYIAGKR
jgi:methyl-accepting chemotaxis protein